MLLVKGFSLLLRDVDEGLASELLGWELSVKIAIAVFQASSRTMAEQRPDGSWETCPEQTAYAILTLAEARNLCFFTGMSRIVGLRNSTFLISYERHRDSHNSRVSASSTGRHWCWSRVLGVMRC